MMTYTEFYNTFTAEDLAGWDYEGIKIKDLYNEYLELSSPPNIVLYPEWALEIM